MVHYWEIPFYISCVIGTMMGRDMDQTTLVKTKERVLRETLETYVTTVKLHIENLERRERILRNLIAEQKSAAEESRGSADRISQARGLLIKELLKRDPEVVSSLLRAVIKEMGLTKEEAKRVLME